MEKQNRFLKGIFIGAVIGGAFTLVDKETREEVLEKGKEVARKTGNFICHPMKSTENFRESIREVKATFQQISEDIAFVTDKVQELKQTTPKMMEIVKDTKEILTKDKE